MPANLSEIVDDLTGDLSKAGSGNGARTQSDQYMSPMSGPMPSMNGSPMSKPSGPVSPYPSQSSYSSSMPPPSSMQPQQANGPLPPSRSAMPPPMDAGASVQQAMAQQAAMEGSIMRPPYSQPYSPLAYATQPGFQGAPMNPLQMPVWQAVDGCAPQGPAPAMSPAAQMQMVKQQRMAQLQAQQQALQAQQQSLQAGQACLKSVKGQKSMKMAAAGILGGADTERLAALKFWLIIISIIILVILVLVAMIYAIMNNSRISDIDSILHRPMMGS